jgi:hypothetical protein
MTTTQELREVLKAHMEKQVIQLDAPSDATAFWKHLMDDFDCVIYKDESKRWEWDYNAWSDWYGSHDYPADVIALNQLAHEFTQDRMPLKDGKNHPGDDLALVNKSGRLLKRFSKFVKQVTGHEIDSAMLGKIGDKLQYYVNQSKSFTIDFHDCIDWKDGMFGHSGSCWWGQYGESRDTFDNAGGWSIRFYDGMDDTQGIGRTWVYPMDNALVCFNSYGTTRADVSKVIKKVFAGHNIELHYHACEVENSNSSTIPYINSGTGFVLAESGHDLLTDGNIDVDMEVEEDNRYTCDHCGDRIDSDETFSGAGGDGCYCESCYNDLFSSCEKCGETFDNSDVHEVIGHSRYSYLCEYCMERIGAVKCDDCGDWVVDDYIVMQDSENCYCLDCAELNAEFTCQCGAMFEYAMDDGDTCESCDWVYCDRCNEMVEDKPDHDDDVHPGDDETTDEPAGDVIPSDALISEESEVTLCRAETNNDPATYTVKVYRLSNVPGLFVYDEHALDKSSDHAYHVMHQCGLAATINVPELSKAIAIMQELGTLTDWNKDKDTILAEISNGLRLRAGQVIRDIMS